MKQITKAKAVKLFRTRMALAAYLGIHRSNVTRWPNGPLPKKYAERIEEALPRWREELEAMKGKKK